MNERDETRLRDMLDEARLAAHFMHEKTLADLEADELLSHALVRALEIIGEAANKVSEETQRNHPIIRWRDIVGMRNRIVHDYARVDLKVVWDTVTYRIPELIEQLEAILESLDDT